MAPVLVLNAGSSSLKARLLAANGDCLWQGQTGWQAAGDPAAVAAAVEAVLAGWLLPAVEPWLADLALVGHRLVHGGTAFTAPTALSGPVLAQLETLVPLAPLHLPPALAVIRWLSGRRPDLGQWACFDTAFHATLPPEAHTYGLPAAWRQRGLRRYGFHGLNHQHVSETVVRPRLISCHLGAGCSLCAIAAGRSIATTMGFTPMDGLVMATRSGSVDPGLLLHLLRQGVGLGDLERGLNQEGGLLGLSDGLSASMKDLRQAAEQGEAAARLAIDVFRFGLVQAIGAMAASLGGVDAIALTGGIGEHDRMLRQELEGALGWLQPVELVVVPADEEGVIARQCRAAAGLG
jgi:acetate kinase